MPRGATIPKVKIPPASVSFLVFPMMVYIGRPFLKAIRHHVRWVSLKKAVITAWPAHGLFIKTRFMPVLSFLKPWAGKMPMAPNCRSNGMQNIILRVTALWLA